MARMVLGSAGFGRIRSLQDLDGYGVCRIWTDKESTGFGS